MESPGRCRSYNGIAARVYRAVSSIIGVCTALGTPCMRIGLDSESRNDGEAGCVSALADNQPLASDAGHSQPGKRCIVRPYNTGSIRIPDSFLAAPIYYAAQEILVRFAVGVIIQIPGATFRGKGVLILWRGSVLLAANTLADSELSVHYMYLMVYLVTACLL
ncbi:hypothetical protein B0T21DRAFT_378306 [Apiosordaria backusii]|uniref:Uncharacterized protein n=1 Tax=Apiosordaria backusii TaxID=314023 RepID=A0AA40DGT3_9PEZI|nr:hypothetical protein B0T21DRAFT_378306 [Apiosordaria backusii]